MKKKNILGMFIIMIFMTFVSACQGASDEPVVVENEVTVVHTQVVTSEVEVTRLVEIPVTITPSLTPQISLTPSLSPTITLTPTITATPKPPIAKILRRAVCHYGPGTAYLYKYGLVEGSRMEVIGRNADGTFAYIQAIGGDNPCWANMEHLEIDSDIFSVVQVRNILPYSEFYGPPGNVSAYRDGDLVVISWDAVYMSEDDYRGYMIEAWLCQDGQLVFTPLRSDETTVTLQDEDGCLEPSSGKLYTAEKHGYTNWVTIPWPEFP